MIFHWVLLLNLIFAQQESVERVELRIKVTNIQTHSGSIEIGIFNNPNVFLKKGKAFENYTIKANADTVICLIESLKKDTYAISLYHDIYADEECNLNILGRPVEPYGLSNNKKPKLRRSKFSNCSFTLIENRTITINLMD